MQVYGSATLVVFAPPRPLIVPTFPFSTALYAPPSDTPRIEEKHVKPPSTVTRLPRTPKACVSCSVPRGYCPYTREGRCCGNVDNRRSPLGFF